MSKTYQLSKSGIERLERFKRDVLAGDFEVRDEGIYFVLSNADSSNCAFTKDESKIVDITVKDIGATLSDVIEKRLHGCGSVFYSTKGIYGAALTRIDITTPAQRALEALAIKLNGDTK